MQNLNNYNDQFRQAMSLQQVSLQETTSQRRLIITDSTIDNSIDIENRNFFYQKSKDKQKDNNQRSKDDYRERDDYYSQNYQSNYQQSIYLSSIFILVYYANSIIYFESTYYTSSRQEISFYFETFYNDSIVYAKSNEYYNEIYYVENDNIVEDAYTRNEYSIKTFITIQTNVLHVDLKKITSSLKVLFVEFAIVSLTLTTSYISISKSARKACRSRSFILFSHRSFLHLTLTKMS